MLDLWPNVKKEIYRISFVLVVSIQ